MHKNHFLLLKKWKNTESAQLCFWQMADAHPGEQAAERKAGGEAEERHGDHPHGDWDCLAQERGQEVHLRRPDLRRRHTRLLWARAAVDGRVVVQVVH